VTWPGAWNFRPQFTRAKELGLDRGGRYAHLFDESQFFDAGNVHERFKLANRGSLATLVAASRGAGAAQTTKNIYYATHPTGRKEPPPPPSTLAFGQHVGRVPLYVSIAYTNQPDRDFASLLTGHRRGLLELARLELDHGTDPEMRATAQRIVDAHAAEDAALQEWRKRKGSK
jgi:hypothetical protein